MKQMDTVRSSEWVPTEADMQHITYVKENLPQASAETFGLTYMLSAADSSGKYIKGHVYKCEKDDDGNYVWSDLNVGHFSVGNCTEISLMMFDDGGTCRVLMSWTDPSDIIIGSETVLWKETRLVHQVGHMPIDANDGTVLVSNTIRGQYSKVGSFSTVIDNDGSRKHYFKLFPVSDDGAITNDDANGRAADYNYCVTSYTSPCLSTSTNIGTTASPLNVLAYTFYATFYTRIYDATLNMYVYTACSTAKGSTDFTWTTDVYTQISNAAFTFKSDIKYYKLVDSVYTELVLGEDYNIGENIVAKGYPIYACTNPAHPSFIANKVYFEYKNSYITWKGIQELVQNGEAEKYFPVGTLLTLPYHGDFGDMAYEVVDFDTVQVADEEKAGGHTMTLESKYLNTWWDYSGGVVFDTNEKSGVLTADTAQDRTKVYFHRIVQPNATTFVKLQKNGTANCNQAAQSKSYDDTGLGALYAESIWDQTGYIPTVDGTSGSTFDTSWRASGTYECELPYTFYKRGNLTTNVYPTTPCQARPYSTDVVPTWNCRLNNAARIRDFTTATSGTRQTTTSNIQRPWYAWQGWGAGKAMGLLNMANGMAWKPRGNSLADYMIACPCLGTSTAGNGTRTYDPLMKYFAPVLDRRMLAKFVGDSGTSGFDVTYTSFCYLYAFDISEDLMELALDLYDDSKSAYFVGDKGATPDTTTFNLTKMCNDLMFNESMDMRYVANKKYYGIKFTAADPANLKAFTASGNRIWYYNKNATDGHYHRIPRSKVTASSYAGEIYELTPDVDYVVGDVIPVKPYKYSSLFRGEAFYLPKKTFEAVASGTTLDGTTKYWMVGTAARHLYGVGTQEGEGGTATYGYRPAIAGTDYTAGTTVAAGEFFTETTITPATTDSDTSKYGWSCDGGYTPVPSNMTDYLCTNDITSSNVKFHHVFDDYYLTARRTSDNACQPVSPGDETANSSVMNYANYRHTEVLENLIYDIGTTEYNNLLIKPSNVERVAYGNHVWAQSNIRMYLNGPFDYSSEYYPVANTERTFHTSTPYYIMAGGTWQRIYQVNATYYEYTGSGSTRTIKYTAEGPMAYTLNTSISDWEAKYNRKVYCHYNEGKPVGCKLELNNPTKFDAYGRSPIQQYYYDTVSGTWKEQFAAAELWWGENGNGAKSVNNGLIFDRLADMFKSACVKKGTDGSAAYSVTTLVGRTTSKGTAASTANSGLQTAVTTYGSNPLKVRPRQSFLHGFLDCQYKRTGDTTPVEGQTYYERTPYGTYVKVTNDTMLAKPYGYALYTKNAEYAGDLSSAKEFLDAIVPVVNRNGAYGTAGALDVYSREDAYFSGTTTVDKVWLMSTAQVAGGDGVNNTMLEAQIRNAACETWIKEKGGTPTGYNSYVYGLQKWRMVWLTGGGVAATLNASRVKKLLTLGVRGTTGYTDSTLTDAYWWLRSAGGNGHADDTSGSMPGWHVMVRWAEDYGRVSSPSWFLFTTNSAGLSPLITLG